jgi:hypothetical protein
MSSLRSYLKEIEPTHTNKQILDALCDGYFLSKFFDNNDEETNIENQQEVEELYAHYQAKGK